MTNEININNEILNEMKGHAISAFPNECVGFFYGEVKDGDKTLTEYQPLQNSKKGDQRRRFEVDPIDYMKAERYALASNQTLLGIYHSHPLHPAVPSVHDLKQAVPFFSYIISSVNEKKVNNTTSWQLNEQNEFEQEQLNK